MKPTNRAKSEPKPSQGTSVPRPDIQGGPTTDDRAKTQLDQVREAVRKSNLPDLEWSTILGAFHADGIGCLEDMAKKLTQTFRDPLSVPQVTDISALMRRTPKRVLETIIHKIPKHPVLCDGVVYDPCDIVRFNGQALLYIVDRTFGGNILVVDDPETIRIILLTYMFAGIADIADVVESKSVPPSYPPLRPKDVPPSGLGGEQPGTEPPAFDQYPYRNPSPGIPSSPDLRLFSRQGFGGHRLDVRAGTQWSDLTKAWIFWPFDDWNDEINSMQPTTSSALFKEHVNFMGSFLIAPKNVYVYSFGDYGWDARISSVLNLG